MNKIYNLTSFKIFSFVQIVSALLFSFCSICFAKDISVLAFFISIIYSAILAYINLIHFLKNQNGTYAAAVRKMSSYLPYLLFVAFILRRAGNNSTSYILDLITVLLWIAGAITSLLVDLSLNPKHINLIISDYKIKPVEKKHKGLKRIFLEVVDWVDSFFWAIFTVMLFQVFVLQLYTIPSESMVPAFLINDRVFVSKVDCGPKFPLTSVGLSDFRKYKHGDTVVLRNPHYSINRKSEVKTVVSQLVYMFTFMKVNLNTDEHGELKADPLVKRVVGVPGEQLVMQDGVLYSRTKDNNEFKPIESDKKYASWNLNDTKVSKANKNSIKTYPLTDYEYQIMLNLEQERKALNLDASRYRCIELIRKLDSFCNYDGAGSEFEQNSLDIYDLFNNIDSIAKRLITQKNGSEWFETFMTSWFDKQRYISDMYEESNFRLNLMVKLTFGELIVKTAECYYTGDFSKIEKDCLYENNMKMAAKLHWYIQGLLDERNMPVFPACDKDGNPVYLPENCYFMMGDNRFNSLDLRHSSNQFVANLTKHDLYSVTYKSMMAPQYVNKDLIIGKPVFRFWPLNRAARVR